MSDKVLAMNKVPVFVGVTGHRNLRAEGEDLTKLEAAVIGVLNEMRKGFEHTEFILLTSLAPGADVTVADIARRNGVRYAIVLPMEKDAFIKRQTDEFDASDEEGQKRIDEYTQKVKTVMESELCMFVHTIPKQARQKYDVRISDDDLQYRAAARFISDNSYAGIALWDGRLEKYDSNKQNGTAGTGPTVRDSLHGRSYHDNGLNGLHIPETRPIYHIYTPREGAQATAYDYKVRRLFPEPLLETGEMWFTLEDALAQGDDAVAKKFSKGWHKAERERSEEIRAQLKTIERFNRDVERYSKSIAAMKSYLGLSQAGACAELCEGYYKAADTLAMKYQKKRHFGTVAIVLLAAFAYMFLNIFSDVAANPLFLALYCVLLVASGLVWALVEGKKLHKYFINYRALAEGLRVQYYWYAAGVHDTDICVECVAQAQDYYLRRQKGHIDWIRAAIRSINLVAVSCNEQRERSVELAKSVADVWLGKMDVYNESTKRWEYPTNTLSNNGQSGYFLYSSISSKKDVTMPKGTKRGEPQIAKRVKKMRLFTALSGISVGVSLIIAFGLAIYNTFLPQIDIIEQYADMAMFISGALPVVAMALQTIKDLMGYEEDVNRYEWYHKVFKRAIVEVDEVYKGRYCHFESDDEKYECITKKLLEIGKEALIENAEWVMINEKRAPQVPSN